MFLCYNEVGSSDVHIVHCNICPIVKSSSILSALYKINPSSAEAPPPPKKKELSYNGIPVCPKTRPLANVAFSSAKCQTNDDDIKLII